MLNRKFFLLIGLLSAAAVGSLAQTPSVSIRSASFSQTVSTYDGIFKQYISLNEQSKRQGGFSIVYIPKKGADTVQVAKGQYKNGVLADTCYWYNRYGQPFLQAVFASDKEFGYKDFIVSYSNHPLAEKGILNGELLQYFDTGDNTKSVIKSSTMYSFGTMHGLQQEWNEDGFLKSKYTYNEGKRNGPYELYYDGRLTREGYYSNGQEDSIKKEYFRNGKIEKLSGYKAGKRVFFKIYFDDPHILYAETYYSTNEREDSSFCYYRSGKRSYESRRDSTGNGYVKHYYENGAVQSYYPYKNNREYGICVAYYSNGTLKAKQVYVQGNIEGVSYAWDEKGRVTDKVTYKNGSRNGLSEQYENGVLIVKENYVNYRLEGTRLEYYTNGKLKQKEEYKNGELLSGVYYDEKGNKLPPQDSISDMDYAVGNIGVSEEGYSGRESRYDPILTYKDNEYRYYNKWQQSTPELILDSLNSGLKVFTSSSEGAWLKKIQEPVLLTFSVSDIQAGRVTKAAISNVVFESVLSKKQKQRLSDYLSSVTLYFVPGSLNGVEALTYYIQIQ